MSSITYVRYRTNYIKLVTVPIDDDDDDDVDDELDDQPGY